MTTTLVKILIVDDEVDIIHSIRKSLVRKGFEVDAYSEPEKALIEFKPNKYDLIISDLKMPKMTGYELYLGMKKKDPNVKIIFLTAFEIHPYEFNKICPGLTATNFILKPVTMTRLIEAIAAQIKN